MNISFDLASFEAAKSRKASSNFNETEETRIANQVIQNQHPITVRSYKCSIDNNEYFALRSKGCKSISVVASEHNTNVLMQYAATGKTDDCLKTSVENENDKGDNKAMLSIAETLLENGQTIQMVPSYKTDGKIRGIWYSRFINFKFYLDATDEIKQMFADHGQTGKSSAR